MAETNVTPCDACTTLGRECLECRPGWIARAASDLALYLRDPDYLVMMADTDGGKRDPRSTAPFQYEIDRRKARGGWLANLTAEQAYPERPDHAERMRQTFKIGDRVRVGPRYQTCGMYRLSGSEGHWYIVGTCERGADCEGGADYKVASTPEDGWECIISASRMVPA